MDARVVFVTAPPSHAEPLLRALIEERLVAGGNIVSGVRSLYRWQGEICDEAESILWMETSVQQVEAMMTRLTELHPYDVPKILTFEPAECPPAYLQWVVEQTQPTQVS